MPIGAVLVSGELVLEAKNEKELRRDPTAHAEMLAAARSRAAARRMAALATRRSTLRRSHA